MSVYPGAACQWAHVQSIELLILERHDFNPPDVHLDLHVYRLGIGTFNVGSKFLNFRTQR